MLSIQKFILLFTNNSKQIFIILLYYNIIKMCNNTFADIKKN